MKLHLFSIQFCLTILIIGGTSFYAIGQSVACTNDLPCDAIDLGTIAYGETIGDFNQGIYNNTCGTNQGEPNPFTDQGVWNDAGVWFTVTTDDNPGFLYVQALNDPENTGDSIDLELAIYELATLCLSGLRFRKSQFNLESKDIDMVFQCPKPNTTYYIFVDGLSRDQTLRRGTFGLQVSQPLINKGADFICDAPDLGRIPEGGSVATDRSWSNYCSSSILDPRRAEGAGFVIQNGVWFEFQAPSSGHVIVEVTPDYSIQALGPQFGVFGTDDGTCSGGFVEFGSIDNKDFVNRPLEVTCLLPNQSYWILVDGFGTGAGIFDVSVQDAGDITPRTTIAPIICAGESVSVGASVYEESGNYVDVINLYEGCDSIVTTDLTVLEPLEINYTIEKPGIGLNEANGEVSLLVTGGDGNYAYTWSNGATGISSNQLIGNQDYCVTIVDGQNCMESICFTMDLQTILIPSFTQQDINCHGDANGQLRFSITGGIAPYNYTWQATGNLSDNTGFINNDAEEILLENLNGGTYFVRIEDAFGDTTFTVELFEPDPLVFSQISLQDASCFANCDGRIDLAVSGGIEGYTFIWDDGTTNSATRDGVCAGNYGIQVVDNNGCQLDSNLIIQEPEAFVVNPIQEREVSCFGGSDGIATVTTNGTPVAYAWENGATSEVLENLTVGTYNITVTNNDGCANSTSISIVEPDQPLDVAVSIANPISCAGDFDGRLDAVVTGPGAVLNFQWSNGSTERISSNLAQGNYAVTVTNEKGCMAEASLFLTEPNPLEISYEVDPITCLSDAPFGELRITDVNGGTPDYQFSLNDGSLSAARIYNKLTEGEYNLQAIDGSGCRKSFQFFVEGPPEVTVDLGRDRTIGLGDSLTLIAQTNIQDLDFQWYFNGEPRDEIDAQLSMQLLKGGLFRVDVLDPVTFCSASTDVLVSIQKQRRVFMPTAFSPNNDGQNDELIIFGGPEVALIRSFQIYDRNGSRLFEANDFLPGAAEGAWNGIVNGEIMPTGPYVMAVVIEFVDGKEQVFSGEVTLMR